MAAPNRSSLLFIFFLSLAVIVPTLRAHIAEYDEYWKQRAAEAHQAAEEAYNPNPEKMTDEFNSQVGMSLMGSNSTRRSLRRYTGSCMATNPIDRRWRCDPNWAKNRKRLANAVLGFGHKTTGGKAGRIYVVTDPSDNDLINPKPGTLRHAVIQKRPLWIIFARSMIIKLQQELIMNSDKTIDGRGANVHIAYGAGITIQFIRNVIIHGVHIHDTVSCSGGMIRDSPDHYGLRTRSDGDGISIFGSSNIWIDHVSMSNCQDGLIDAVQGSTAITISNCHFTNHNEVMLFGASDSYSGDQIMQITVAFNHFGRGLVQRMPRCRWGFVHVVNNDYTHWLMYAIGGSSHPTIISQGNRFIAPPNAAAKEVTKREYAPESEWKNWLWKSEGDLLMNGAFFPQSGDPHAKHSFSKLDMIKYKPGTFVTRLTRFSGSLKCVLGKAC
ncbi:Pec_lyase_C domain-containing protein/Pec_lyase_N domain-containing protein [Cephalotus follicularis]|uniref:Pectate lyase n=1 Tax=Cephalotus follicularis TaxID=3775 RepID=A0A1Q3B6Y0_CEPFO|nr:Pec_lyase_C domain-containing protein/Pec_lyase_N domain-containing protein [Cephalotus follicularis]